jgi:tetratricopeptide (TPR) repeat protein
MKVEVEQIFHALADLSPEARAQYLAEHRIDAEIRCEVEALLKFDAGASTFLMRDVSVAASQALPQLESKGWRCGPYRLLEVVGRGGMGTVYLAERVDGEVTQRVAVKLVAAGAGEIHRERFLQERQILASLAHPNIARMLDAGHLENGQPYLAMEYVEGQPIDVYTAGMGVRQKIELFLKVCAPVAYLHRNLVVHRDLKPSNILVMRPGSGQAGEPKLLDFGIAKILDISTDSTLTILRMLTPDYASPEQVSGGAVSTATDIYSLGALLYKLLTGKPAHQFEDRSPEGIASAVTTREVIRPSRWAPDLKGDLESILLKALRKDPQERYATVDQFAEDLEAFLASRAVRARSGTSWYRARKFLRRHWVPVTMAGLAMVALTAGMYVTLQQRALAQRRFQDVRSLANRLFDIDAQVRGLAGSSEARQLIVNTSLDYLRRLTADVQGDPRLALELANAYLQVARVEGVANAGPNLGQADKAERDLRNAGDLVRSALAWQPGNRKAILQAAQIARDRMDLAWQAGNEDQGLALARESADWLRKFNAAQGDRADAMAILSTYSGVARFMVESEHFDEALDLARRGSQLAAMFGGPRDRGDFLRITAVILRYQGQLDEALKAAQEAERRLDPGPSRDFRPAMIFVLTLTEEGLILGEDNAVSLGRSEEAVATLQRAYDLADEFVHKDPHDQASRTQLANVGSPLADILSRSDPRRALIIYDHTLRHLAEIRGNSPQQWEVALLAGSSYSLRRLGLPSEARRRLDTAFADLKELHLYPADKIDAWIVSQSLSALADQEAGTGHAARAIEVYEALLKGMLAGGTDPKANLTSAMSISRIWASLATLERAEGHADRAAALESQRLNLWRQWDRRLPNNPFVLRQIAASTTSGL